MDGYSAGRVDLTVADSAQSILKVNRPLDIAAPPSSEKDLEDTRAIARVQKGDQSSTKDSNSDAKGSSGGVDLEALSENLNKAFEKSTGIRFQLSDESGEVVIQVVDLQSEEVIRSIPSDRVAELKKNFQEFRSNMAGVLVDQRA